MINEYVLSLSKTISFLNKNNISWRWVFGNSPIIHQARQNALDQANTFDYNKIFWIDSDISWSHLDFFSLYNSKEDIIGGSYLRSHYFNNLSNRDLECFTYIDLKNPYLDRSYTIQEASILSKTLDVIEVSAIGFGFICITKKAMNEIPNPFMPLFQEERIIQDEDLAWCLKIKSKGYKIMFNPSIVVGHHKTVNLSHIKI